MAEHEQPTTREPAARADRSAEPDDSAIGLCLSGGGFRASFYALGALRYLAEAGLLPRLAVISAVSGGSIAAAALADRWNELERAGATLDAFLDIIDKPFRDAATTDSLRKRWFRWSLLSVIPFTGGRGGAYARALAPLYQHKRIADLPAKPEVILTATDLSGAHAFRIAAAYIGSWDYGYIEPTPTSVALAKAVAASAAFPPSLTVVRLPTDDLRFPKTTPSSKIPLVDGGVYDNMGLEWFQGWGPDALRPAAAVKPPFVIVVNASGILEQKNKKFLLIGALLRELAIQYQQVLNVRNRWRYATAQAQPDGSTYMAIKDDPRNEALDPALTADALPSELVRPLALLRTDLDRFHPDEADLLSYHAYWTLHARLGTSAPNLALKEPAWTQYANLEPAEMERLRILLKLGARRFFRRIRRILER